MDFSSDGIRRRNVEPMEAIMQSRDNKPTDTWHVSPYRRDPGYFHRDI